VSAPARPFEMLAQLCRDRAHAIECKASRDARR
jgi:hypothetical protein